LKTHIEAFWSFGGVRPSSGAATRENAPRAKNTLAPDATRLAAPEDGRTPLNTCWRRGIFHFLFSILQSFSLLGVVEAPARAQEAAPSEFQLKAAFIYNFAKFVEWPPEAFRTQDSPFIIGIIGDNTFDDILRQTVRNKQISGHPFRVVQCKTLADLQSCHILFISLSERKRLAEILRAIRSASVLTISDLEHFLPAGGMIQFLMEGNKVRFAINDTAAKEVGLRISSKLLNLAKRPEPEGKP